MRKSFCAMVECGALAAAIFGGTAAFGQDGNATTKRAIRVVDCDQRVQSHKRGVCANHLNLEDFTALAPAVSWWYNWHYQSKDAPPAGAAVEFVPMAWGDRSEDLAGLNSYLAAGNKPRAVLAINEPNLKGQAFISPERTASLYARIKAIADRYSVPVVGPHMALGSATDSSITAMDPIEKKEVTYRFMVPFLKAVLFYTDQSSVEVPAAALHTYGSVDELRWAVNLMHKEFGRPVWVTEYAQWKTPNPQAALTYMIQATDFLERTPYVTGYAWFKERVEKNPGISLFENTPGKLTALGEAYIAAPVHDADVHYRIPGRLQAENYVSLTKMEIYPTSDSDGFAQMSSTAADGWTEYNVQVDAAGTYDLHFRVAGQPGKIDVLEREQTLGSVDSNPEQWQTVVTSLQLPAGPQTIRVRCEAKGQSINWIEFARR